LLKDAIVLDLGDLQRQAERLRLRAQAEADGILAQSRQRAREREAELEAQADSIREKARQQGRAEGHAEGVAAGLEEGRQQGRDEVLAALRPHGEKLVERLAAVVEQFEQQRETIEREAREAVVQLALRLAERVVHRVVEVDPTVVVDQVLAALTHVLRPSDVTIRVHPEDRAVLDDVAPGVFETVANVRHVAWQEDESMARGGCSVSYGRGRIDASIETQLRRIAEMLAPATAESENHVEKPD
jgi:flagellar assembly protein FliH